VNEHLNALMITRLQDVYESLARGYPIHPDSYISSDGKPAITSIGNLLRVLDQLPAVTVRDHHE